MTEQIFTGALTSRQPFATRVLSAAVVRDRLAHAYLLVGRAQDDKLSIARELCCLMNCSNARSNGYAEACLLHVRAQDATTLDTTACQNCRWIYEGKHPQAWLTLSGEETKSGKISVEKARLLGDELGKESQYTRAVVIPRAGEQYFHRPAANALLKTIEDPRVACIFFLFAVTEEEVLPTIVSRCQVVPLRTTDALGLTLTHAEVMPADESIHATARALVDKLNGRRDHKTLAAVLEQSRALTEALSEEFTAGEAIDLLLSMELKRLREKTANADTARYLSRLYDLAQTSKEQIDHYVSTKAVIESFALSWYQMTEAPVR